MRTPNTTYFYKVLAMNANGDGTYSSEASATTSDQYTKLLLHGESLADSSSYSRAITSSGVTVSSAQSKFGGSGLFFSGSSYLSLADSDDWNFGSSDFTVDLWFSRSSINTSIYHKVALTAIQVCRSS